MSKLKTPFAIIEELSQGFNSKQYDEVIKAIKESQRNAIEVALELASEKATVETLMKNMRTKKFYKPKTETFEFDPLNFEMKNQVNKDSILNLINSNELKV